MAQRTIHYLFGEMISRQTQIRDKKRFLLGSILPDAIETANRNLSHFKVETETHKFFDFRSFRNRYFQQILQDDLYLGYYMHLVEDAFYRNFFYMFPRKHLLVLHNLAPFFSTHFILI